ncbi:hypothetical protein K4F52_008324 [Lecanicillium sp. MT-2017a]|nr:hypothetical protein K4F52_008324 [Lecanicillium sp. MT-2017a]
MAATASASATLSQPAVDGDLEDSNVSSPLSEVDDKDENDEDIERMQIQRDEGDNSSMSGDENPAANDGSDSESILSDARSEANSEANDTEAETERLYDTPRHQRQKDVVVDQYNRGQVFEHTPSKLRRAATLSDSLTHPDDVSASGDDAASVASSVADADESPSKPSNNRTLRGSDESKRESQDRKRKRSPVADQSESDQPLRKRTGSVGAASVDMEDEATANDEDKTNVNLDSAVQSGAEEDEATSNDRDTGTEGEGSERTTRSTKKATRSNLKHSEVADAEDTGTDIPDEAGEAVNEQQEDEELEADAEEEADAAARNIEEMERKQNAFRDWTHIEEMFGIFRDRLYKDRLERLEEEEQSLLADVPTHREYLNMKQCLDDRLGQKSQEVKTEFEFQLKAHEQWAVAQRAQIWSQFFQAIREKREQTLESLNKQWYSVQTARRSAHSLTDYGLLFPKDPSQRVRNAIAYNSEVSALAGVAKYDGFPTGPEMKGASTSELKSDLNAMDRSKRGRQKSGFHARDDYHTTNIHQLGPAGEQFLKDTPWANPNHSAHKMVQSATAQDPPAQLDGKAAIDAGGVSKRSPAVSTRLSESPELSRSILNSGANQMKRVGSVPTVNRGSKTAAV